MSSAMQIHIHTQIKQNSNVNASNNKSRRYADPRALGFSDLDIIRGLHTKEGRRSQRFQHVQRQHSGRILKDKRTHTHTVSNIDRSVSANAHTHTHTQTHTHTPQMSGRRAVNVNVNNAHPASVLAHTKIQTIKIDRNKSNNVIVSAANTRLSTVVPVPALITDTVTVNNNKMTMTSKPKLKALNVRASSSSSSAAARTTKDTLKQRLREQLRQKKIRKKNVIII